MTPRDLASLAAESLLLHRLRTGLTLGAVAIGVLAVLLLTAVGDAAKRYVMNQFASVGASLLTVSPGRIESSGLGGFAPSAGAHPLTLQDADAVERRVTSAAFVAPLSLGTAAVEYGSRRRSVILMGTTPAYLEMRTLELATGAFLPPGEAARDAHVIVIGAKLARELFGSENPVGRPVRVAEARFRVIGVLAAKGTTLGIDVDDLALVPVGTGLSLLNQANLHHILVKAASTDMLQSTRAQVTEVLVERHREEDFTIITQDAMLATFRRIMDALTLGLAGIAAISLAVAGVGIMNVMLVSVSERTEEIGLLKSLGGRPRDVLSLFLAEAAGLSLLGALAGVAVGLSAIAVGARVWPTFPIAPSGAWVAIVVAFALATGLLFGFLPARRAARLPAAEALRGGA